MIEEFVTDFKGFRKKVANGEWNLQVNNKRKNVKNKFNLRKEEIHSNQAKARE